MSPIIVAAVIIFGIAFLIWLGLQVKPAAFLPYPEKTPPLETTPLPAGLPAPVDRFYRAIYGEAVPLITSAVLTGRGPLRIKGITFPARFRFVHLAGQGYRHYLETTFFGLPFMKVHELYLDGASHFELPFGVLENDPNTNQGANLGLWAEAVWYPAAWLTDPRVRWEAIDDATAILVVPFGEDEDRFVVRFDPETGLLRYLEAMRYREPEDVAKRLWIPEVRAWQAIDGYLLPSVSSLTWFDQGKPWAVLTLEAVVYNVGVETYIRQRGL